MKNIFIHNTTLFELAVTMYVSRKRSSKGCRYCESFLTIALRQKDSYHPHLIDEETEAHGS